MHLDLKGITYQENWIKNRSRVLDVCGFIYCGHLMAVVCREQLLRVHYATSVRVVAAERTKNWL